MRAETTKTDGGGPGGNDRQEVVQNLVPLLELAHEPLQVATQETLGQENAELILVGRMDLPPDVELFEAHS